MKIVEKIKEWNIDNLNSAISTFISQKNIKFSYFGKPIRYILTNSENGPSISLILKILGKENTLMRLNKYISRKHN